MALEYFTEAELRALPQMSDTTRYPLARVEAAAAYIVAIIERVVGTSFVVRTRTQVFDGGDRAIALDDIYARSLTSVTVDGAAVTLDDLSLRGGLVAYRDRRYWASGDIGNVTITYAAGYSTTPPPDIKEAALAATRWRLLATNSNAEMEARQTQVTNEYGGTTVFAVAGAERPTGYPEVDAVIIGWRDRLNVFGFA